MKHAWLVASVLSVVCLPAVALADNGHSRDDQRAYGEPGDSKKPARVVQVLMKETDGGMVFVPDRIVVRKGEQIRFSMKNHGESDHEFVLGTSEEIAAHAEQMRKNPDMEHDDPNSKRLHSKQNGDLVWRFTNTGMFEFACLIPGHLESGMKGVIVVR